MVCTASKTFPLLVWRLVPFLVLGSLIILQICGELYVWMKAYDAWWGYGWPFTYYGKYAIFDFADGDCEYTSRFIFGAPSPHHRHSREQSFFPVELSISLGICGVLLLGSFSFCTQRCGDTSPRVSLGTLFGVLTTIAVSLAMARIMPASMPLAPFYLAAYAAIVFTGWEATRLCVRLIAKLLE